MLDKFRKTCDKLGLGRPWYYWIHEMRVDHWSATVRYINKRKFTATVEGTGPTEEAAMEAARAALLRRHRRK